MIEDLIYRALLESPTLETSLALHDGEAAVFYARSANDIDPNWHNDQTPYSVYMVEWTHDAERTKVGVLSVDILCLADQGTPTDIADGLVKDISGMFFSNGEETYSIIWSRSDAFETDGAEPKKLGVTVYFDIVGYPIQYTTTPDPVLSTMNWIKERQPDIKVIGKDELEELWLPTDENPACYVRLGGETSQVKPTYACVWLRANMVVHIICPSPRARVTWLKRLVDDLAIEAEIITDDESPMFIKSLSVNSGANPISAGQLTFDGEYGVLRKEPEKPKLLNPHFSGMEV